jgi:hypothetical protein
VARDLGIGQSLLSRWVQNAKVAALPGALTAAEREELRNSVARTAFSDKRGTYQKGGSLLREGDAVGRHRFIAAEKARGTWSIRRMCSALKVSRAGFLRATGFSRPPGPCRAAS